MRLDALRLGGCGLAAAAAAGELLELLELLLLAPESIDMACRRPAWPPSETRR